MRATPPPPKELASPAPAFDQAAFLALADRFIALANQANRSVSAPDVALPFLYAAARYVAFIAVEQAWTDNQGLFVADMSTRFRAMLEQHLADPTLRG